MSKRKI